MKLRLVFSLRYLAYCLELVARRHDAAPPRCADKMCLLMHLEAFSFLNNPPMHVTRETIKMLVTCYAERLGTCVLYQPPRAFALVWAGVKHLVDPKTRAKIVFVRGDVSDGAPNDRLLRYLIGDDWKALTGCEQPVRERHFSAYFGREIGASPGFVHDEYWAGVLASEAAWSAARPAASAALAVAATAAVSVNGAAGAKPRAAVAQPPRGMWLPVLVALLAVLAALVGAALWKG